jgi:hypothetical protein
MIATIIILSLIIVALGFATINLLNKLERYEEIVLDYDEFMQDETQRNEALLEALRQIDNRQMFEKDDEVGSIFYQIKETIERFKQR